VLFFSAFVHFCTIFTLFSPNFQSPIPSQNRPQKNLEKIIELTYKKDGLFFKVAVRENSSSFKAVLVKVNHVSLGGDAVERNPLSLAFEPLEPGFAFCLGRMNSAQRVL
jgi:hypothetical protein